VDKDYSHPWFTKEMLQNPEYALAKFQDDSPWLRIIFPFVGWPVYLYGLPDGCHLFPFSSQRMWKESPSSEYTRCFISSFVVFANLAAAYYLCGMDVAALAYYYLAPWVIFGWWLVCVTYLQHHNHDTLVYDNDNWKFVDAAFETVDRKFGFGIDTLSHHITDGHVAHHLFFTKIPHYNLPIATAAIKKYLEENNLSGVYKFEKTYDFFIRVHKYMVQVGNRAAMAPHSTTEPVVAAEPKKSK
jgi:acyl-lipid omega-3 desaturase